MLISLDWIRDFVDLSDNIDVRELAERFTLTTAEVEQVIAVRKGERSTSETAALIDDWVIEIDNKSITHRPDLWGHYGIAREIAAIYKLPLKPLEVAPGEELDDEKLPEIPITIDDPKACPRYSAILFEGVKSQASPESMQARLINVGIRPIDALVDLTNYVMAEIGQPMHAFDGGKVKHIEVGFARKGDVFVTLDGVQRKMPEKALMIQSNREHIALAGIMGGLATEVTRATTSILLESATFGAATIRRCATALGHRTEASARFEKSLDPANTVLGIGRFVHLAREQFSDLKLTSRLSDCFPEPPEPLSVQVNPSFVAQLIGTSVPFGQMKDILEAIEFKVADKGEHVEVVVPSFRATKDISEEADIIEEIARYVGFGNITPVLPQTTVRQVAPNAIHELENRSLQLLCGSEGYHEVQDYVWYHDDWLGTLGYEPGHSIRLKNPAASGLTRLRKTIMPGLLRASELNRREFPALKLAAVGTAFDNLEGQQPEQIQHRHLGLVSYTRGKQADDALLENVKGSLSKWARDLFDHSVVYSRWAENLLPWEHPAKTAQIVVADRVIGRLSCVPLNLRRAIDEHFAAWSVALAELNLSSLADLKPPQRNLPAVSAFPTVEIDYSVLLDAARPYQQVYQELRAFEHDLLIRLSFEGSYEGKNIPTGQRSLLLRARIGDAQHTLTEEDIKDFRSAFEKHLAANHLTIRGATSQ